MSGVGNCGNLRDGLLVVARRVFDRCAQKSGGCYRRCLTTIDHYGNVDVRKLHHDQNPSALKDARVRIVGTYKFSRAAYGVLTPSSIADDIEAVTKESSQGGKQ
jgi:hypothetical protein